MEIEGLLWQRREQNLKEWGESKRKDNGKNKYMFILMQNLHINILTHDLKAGESFAGKKMNRLKKNEKCENNEGLYMSVVK